MYANPLGVCSTQADTQTHWGDGAYCGVVLRLHSSCLILFLPFLPSTPATQSLPFLSGGVTAQSRGATLQGHTMARSTILPAGWEGSGNLWWGASCMRSETPELDGRVWRGNWAEWVFFFNVFSPFSSFPLLSFPSIRDFLVLVCVQLTLKWCDMTSSLLLVCGWISSFSSGSLLISSFYFCSKGF